MKTETTMQIEGVDCPSCVGPIEKAVCALPGVNDASVNFNTGKIKLDIDEGGADAKTIEKTINKLGYKLAKEGDSAATGGLEAWYKTKKGKLVVFTGVMLVLATLVFILAKEAALSIAGFSIEIFELGYAIAALVALAPMAKKAFNSARSGSPFTIDTLVTFAVVGAIAIGASVEAAVVVFLFALGEMLESMATAKARKSVQALADLAPKMAFLVTGEEVNEVAAETLTVGDVVEIQPGGRVPADGEIVEGSTSLDESSITGESIPVRREVGHQVYAGAINTDGVIRLRVDKTAADNMIARIMNLVEEAEAGKSPTARFIDEFSRYYTPGVLVVGILVGIVPPLAFGAEWMEWIYKGLAIWLIGCPCALVLSTPAAITSGIAAGARRGLLMKGGVVLEAISKVTTIAFDKTGTLTEGTPKVTDMQTFNGTEDEMLAFAAAVEATSSHPLAVAIVDTAKQRKLKFSRATAAKALSGRGVQGKVGNAVITIASPRYAVEISKISEAERKIFTDFEEQGKTLGVVVKGKTLLGVIAMRDELREDAREAMDQLRAMQIKTIMLTGDNARTGKAIAAQLGMEVQAELMPDDKLQTIESLKADGGVAMVGDGINDAPALARADVGIAMGGGTDVALETADAALLRERVGGIPALVRLSNATMKNIRQNIVFSLILKVVFLITTMLGYTDLWMAILADTGATVLVTMNALRLLKFDQVKSNS
ncbi:Lead, cadmium, zinc and mercury transporting ATPase; Copper-translocating P-type ATPase [hydrothermal vent metagenome]|uniref:Lead, cadmium, zinc and mercury transporting ATPase Copper-translocating P-type ATPase n=2 Tax=hydrothermal vent metagenome TaxID=652676 RepID=A0A3B0RNJ4_9ZZZZ